MRTSLALLCLTASGVGVAALQQFRPDEPAAPEPHGWYWGAVDANIDWCERNYDTSTYIAEFWNALSSLPITLFALAGYILGAKHARIESRFKVGFAWMMVVGLGSFMFHATLRRYAQCMDELPMLYASISLFYNTLDYAPRGFGMNVAPGAAVPASRRLSAAQRPFWTQVQYRLGLKVLLLTCGVVLTAIYFYLPGWFLVFFLGYSTFLMSFCCIMAYHIFCNTRSSRRNEALRIGPHGYEAVNTNAGEDMNGAKPYSPVLSRLFYGAVLGYFGGFVFWNYENTFCSTLPPWMQLHAVWHIMAGLGTFCAIQCQIAWRAEELGGRTSVDMELGGKVLPIVVARFDV